jgi:hypothetical protein
MQGPLKKSRTVPGEASRNRPALLMEAAAISGGFLPAGEPLNGGVRSTWPDHLPEVRHPARAMARGIRDA